MGSCQQVVMINLRTIKSHVKKPSDSFKIVTEPFHLHLSYIPKYALLCFLNSFGL